MNHCAIQQKREAVVCPKPRRLTLINSMVDEPQPMRWHVCHNNQEACDAKAGNELLEIILAKGGSYMDRKLDSSPRYFSGSPPGRASNPLINDSLFREENFDPIFSREITLLPSDSTRRGGGPTVRVEGFECLDRDRRNRSISTVA